MEQLIKANADVNAKEKDNWTSLHVACQNGTDPIVKFLLDNGAEVDSKTTDGFTPLHIASLNSNFFD